jgi:hypothetical protein
VVVAKLLLGFFFVNLDHFAALVVPAIRADGVRQAHGTAIAARNQAARWERIVSATAVAATFGYFTFRLWGHVFLLRFPQHLFGYGNFMNMPGKCPAQFPDDTAFWR